MLHTAINMLDRVAAGYSIAAFAKEAANPHTNEFLRINRELSWLICWNAAFSCIVRAGFMRQNDVPSINANNPASFIRYFIKNSSIAASPNDIAGIPPGSLISFIRIVNFTPIHAMLSLGSGFAAGSNNHSCIANGRREWSMYDLRTLQPAAHCTSAFVQPLPGYGGGIDPDVIRYEFQLYYKRPQDMDFLTE